MRRTWPLILAASFAFGLAASWQRWANPVIDGGREMNQPLRLADGEALYSGVGHIYGPLSPYLHAALYRAFGPSLDVLYADGIVSAIAILTLVYFLARRIMDQPAAATATLLVMWLCAFKASGNYVFPYAYSALHGTLFSLVTLTLCASALERPSVLRFVAAGLAAGVTTLAKTEMGLAALCGGVAAAALAGGPVLAASHDRASEDSANDEDAGYVDDSESDGAHRAAQVAGRTFRPGVYAITFVAAAIAVAGAVYTAIAWRVGWRTLMFDCWLLAYNLPAPLKYFNASLSGLDYPAQSLLRISIAFIKVVLLGVIVAAIAQFRAGPAAGRPRAWAMLGAAAALATLLGVTTGLDWDRGPFLAMPFVLLLMILIAEQHHQRLVLLYSLFALAALARVILHVRSGGAYGSFLLPVSIIIFTYAWVRPFPALFRMPDVARAARALALGLLLTSAIATSIAIAERYRRLNTGVISTPRGTLIVPPAVAEAWNGALAFIDARTRPGDPIAVLPEGTSLTFLSARRNPLREEIVTPGFLDDAAEDRAIRQIGAAGTPLILIVDRATREFGAETFGRDYDRRLMTWIAARYEPCGTFGTAFVIRAYCQVPIRT
jgi:hypothetical protein